MLFKRSRALRSAAAALVLLLILTVLPSGAFGGASAASAPGTGLLFSGSVSGSQLTVSVSVCNPDLPLDSGMFLLEFDTAVLSSTAASVKVQGKAKSAAVYFNAYYGYVGLDWYYSPRLAASATASDVASITFTIKSGKTVSRISDVLSVSTNTTYLKNIGGYQNDGGLLLCSGSTVRSASKKNITPYFVLTNAKTVRLGGFDRFATANLIAEEGWASGSKNAVIASGLSFADALCGVPLASALDAPILLVQKDSLPNNVRDELKKLGVTKIYILGGTGAVGSNVQTALAKIAPVERIYGADRFKTAVAVAEKLTKLTGTKPSNVFLASALSFPDAMAVSPVAALNRCPILYAPKTGKLDSATLSYIKSCGCKTATVLGGTGVIAATVQNSAKVGSVSSVSRISGKDRYATSLSICTTYASLFPTGSLTAATGLSFPDALAGGALAAKLKAPLLLIDNGAVSADAKKFAASRKLSGKFCIFGGTGALPEAACWTLLAQ